MLCLLGGGVVGTCLVFGADMRRRMPSRNRFQDNSTTSNIIGQFGVGFYSAFMVAEDVTLYTKSARPDEPSYQWRSSGCVTGTRATPQWPFIADVPALCFRTPATDLTTWPPQTACPAARKSW